MMNKTGNDHTNQRPTDILLVYSMAEEFHNANAKVDFS